MATQELNGPAAGRDTPAARRGRLYITIIFALFLVPLVLAWGLVGLWRPAGSVHHGELLDPVRPVPALQGVLRDGTPLAQSGDASGDARPLLQGRWTLLYLGTRDCGPDCRSRLDLMRQLRLGLAKELSRVQTVLLLPAATPVPLEGGLQAWLDAGHAAMNVVVPQTDDVAGFVRGAFAIPDGAAADTSFFLLDPLGNLVMRYTADTEPGQIISDMERLLKLSRIGRLSPPSPSPVQYPGKKHDEIV